MQEKIELRIPEDAVRKYLGEPCGRDMISGHVRRAYVSPGDSLYMRVAEAVRSHPDELIHAGWGIIRSYSPSEIEAAELFHIGVLSYFEPMGEECGTVYDDSDACPDCEGTTFTPDPLILNLRRAPRSKHIAASYTPEIIVSQEFAECVRRHGITGCALRPVIHKAYARNPGVLYDKVPSGRALMAKAKKEGVSGWELSVWLYEKDQAELNEQAEKEYREMLALADRTRLAAWYQLVITSKPVSVAPPTQTGVGPFKTHIQDPARCSHAGKAGHVLGLNRLSELSIERDSWDGSDIAATGQLFGQRGGLKRPSPKLVVSPRFYHILKAEKLKGFYSEVAYLR